MRKPGKRLPFWTCKWYNSRQKGVFAMKDKIKRYARLLWKYKWIVAYVASVIFFAVGSMKGTENDMSFWGILSFSGVLSLLLVGGMWLLVLYIRFTISYCKDIIDLNKYLDEATFESRYQREVERRRRKAEKRMKLKKKIQMLRNRL